MEKEIVFSASKWLKTWRENPFFTVVVKMMIIVTLKVLLLFFPLVFVVKIKISYKYIN